MGRRESGRDPAAERFTRQRGFLGPDDVEKAGDVVDIAGNFIIIIRLVGQTMSQHVDRPGAKMFAVGADIAAIGLGMAAGAVQKQHYRLVVRAGMQIAGAHAVGVLVAL